MTAQNSAISAASAFEPYGGSISACSSRVNRSQAINAHLELIELCSCRQRRIELDSRSPEGYEVRVSSDHVQAVLLVYFIQPSEQQLERVTVMRVADHHATWHARDSELEDAACLHHAPPQIANLHLELCRIAHALRLPCRMTSSTSLTPSSALRMLSNSLW